MQHFGVLHSVLDAKHNSRLRSLGFPLGGPFSFGRDILGLQKCAFADANPDSRLAILLGSPGVPNWSSATLNHESSLAIWTSKTVILQMLITIVA